VAQGDEFKYLESNGLQKNGRKIDKWKKWITENINNRKCA